MHEQRAHDDLAMIRRLMEDGRREVVDRGKHFMIWGVISTIGLVHTWFSVQGEGLLSTGSGWLVLLALGWGGSFVVGWRDSRGARVRTLARRLLSAVWVSAGVSLTLIGAAGVFGPGDLHQWLPGLMSAVIAAPVAVTAVLTGERWLGLVAAGWWVGGAVMLVVLGPGSLLVMAAMSVLLLLVPGVVLNARARRRAVSAAAEG